jgi:hypothetical protein
LVLRVEKKKPPLDRCRAGAVTFFKLKTVAVFESAHPGRGFAAEGGVGEACVCQGARAVTAETDGSKRPLLT